MPRATYRLHPREERKRYLKKPGDFMGDVAS